MHYVTMLDLQWFKSSDTYVYINFVHFQADDILRQQVMSLLRRQEKRAQARHKDKSGASPNRRAGEQRYILVYGMLL